MLFVFSFSSCSSNSNKSNPSQYEYIVKDDTFREKIKDSVLGSFIRLKQGYTYYELANPEMEEPVIVLIHGFSVPSYIWEPTFQKAKDLGYKVLRFDLYGRGYSGNLDKDYTDELFARQGLELLDSLSIDKSILIGLSNGGRVISKMANIDPDRVDKMIYVSSNGFNDVVELNDKTVSETEISNYIKNYKFLSQSQKNDFKKIFITGRYRLKKIHNK